jgi:porphobilinogen synthase
MSIPSLVERVRADVDVGVHSVLLFGVTDAKDDRASAATDPDGVVPRAVRALREAFADDLLVMTDVCLCGATDHGHCGVLVDGIVDNDASLPLLAEAALAYARAGADVVAPSDMMDMRVGAIRDRLDEEGYGDTAILSYSTKFASAFYGPFRDAASSAPKAGDRKSYQMDSRNRREALRESMLDEDEGADMLMVKPALSYLDVISDIAAEADVPVAAYNVSGEYSMVKAAAERGWVDEGAVVAEILGSIARAGADLIISYHARDAVEKGWLP